MGRRQSTPRRPLRVCMLAYTHYESDNRVMRYAETLAARGDTVDVLALRHRNDEPPTANPSVNVLPIQARTRNESTRIAYLCRVLTFLVRAACLLHQRHRRQPYDLIHVHSVPDFLVLAAAWPRQAGAKVILDIHDLLPEFYASKFAAGRETTVFKVLRWIERRSAALAEHVIIANDLWRARLIRRSVPGEKCTTILNYPDPRIFARQQTARRNDRFVFLYPGSLNWHQGVDLAIRAFAKIKERVPHAEFHIYGAGPEKTRLRQLAGELNLAGRVQIRDSVSLRKVAGIMAAADVAVVPKRGDTFGNEAFSTKTLEFMMLGVPVIVAATAIDQFYFNESLVKFFRPDDSDDLAAAMLQLFEDPRLRDHLVGNAAAFAQRYDWRVNQHIYLDLVDALTRPASGCQPS